jgi:transposase
MSASDLSDLSREDLIRLILELHRQLEVLKKQNEELRRNQKRSATPFSKGKPKPNPNKPGRKPGQGPFRRREQPEASPNSPPVDVPVEETVCPICGGRLEPDGEETVSNTDMPPRPEAETSLYRVHICRCQKCNRRFRGQHPDVASDQYGATGHRVGPRVMAMAHALHYGHGVPVRRVPEIVRELTGVRVTQSAITQDALKQAGGEVGARYQQLRQQVREAPVTYTDDTGWKVGGKAAYLMGFDTDRETVYPVRSEHGHEQVMEIIPGDYAGTLVTDRGVSYEAKALQGVEQSKCLSHLIRNVSEVVENKRGSAKRFGLKLQEILLRGNQLWRDYQDGKVTELAEPAREIDEELKRHLRHRRLRDPDNQRLLDGIGLQNDQGRVLRFLKKPDVEPTNNRAERILRPAVIARKVSHCSKNERGAEAHAAFQSVLQTAKKVGTSLSQSILQLAGLQ